MDLQYIGITVAVFGVVLACLLFFFKFGIKEKSYEEALAEQRQQANALLGPRPKPKEKKVKKSKKSKEKQSTAKGEQEESDVASESNSTSLKPHVEFKEPETIVPEKVLPPVPAQKKLIKKEKVKPILVNKKLLTNHVHPMIETPPANHFETLHPKDEFELLHSHIKEEQKVEKQTKSTKKEEPKSQPAVKEKGNKPKPLEQSNKKSSDVELVVTKQNAKKSEQESKQNKKVVEVVANKKNVKPLEVVQQIIEEKKLKVDAVDTAVVLSKTNGIVVNGGKEKKKKKGEFNTLQQLAGDKQAVNLSILLNLVRKAELSRSEVQILIDLLLNKQHEAPNVLDWTEGKSDPVQKLKKQLAEKEKLLQDEQQALIGAQNKLREIRAEQNAEKSQLNKKIRQLEETLQSRQLELHSINNRLHQQTQKFQQLQAQLNEEILNSRKLREEHSTLIVQRQQMECRLAQAQEADAIIAQLRNDVQELNNKNNQLNIDLHTLHNDNEGHQNYIVQLKQQIATYQQDLGKYQKELEQSSDFLRQQEEARVILERHVEMARLQASEVEAELVKIKAAYQQSLEDVRRLEIGEGKTREELAHLQQQKDEVESLVGKLKKELAESHTENEKLQQQQTSGTIEQNKIHQVERLNLQNEITSLKSQLQQTETRLTQEIQTAQTTINNLESSLTEQKNKNDELRKKNWKVMEALNAAESKTKKTVIVDEVAAREQENSRKFIQRLFPEVQKLGNLPQDEWFNEVEKLIRKEIVRKTEQPDAVTKLQAQIVTYKNIIDDTEGTLNKLQKHIEQQEINWRSQLKAREGEIENLKVNTVDRLQRTVTTLENQIEFEKEEKRVLQEQIESLKSRSTVENDSSVLVKRLSEQIDRLRAQLQEKQNGNAESIVQPENSLPKAQTLPSNGPALIQRHLSYSSSADSSLTEVTIKPKNKKKKKKGNGQ